MSLFPTKYGTQGTLTVLFMSVAVFACFSLTAFAGETVISNSVSVTAESGGNTATGGDGKNGASGESVTVSGQTHSSVDVETTVNGEVVESVHKESTDGEPLIIETKVESDGVEVHVTGQIGSSTDLEKESQGETASSTPTEENEATTTEEQEREQEENILSHIIETVTEFMAYVFSFFRA